MPRKRKSTPRRRRPLRATPPAFPTLAPLAERLEDVRLTRGMTQSAVAKHVGICAKHYPAIAHAQAAPSAGVLLRIAAVLSVPVETLFGPTPITADGWLVTTGEVEDPAATYTYISVAVGRITGKRAGTQD